MKIPIPKEAIEKIVTELNEIIREKGCSDMYALIYDEFDVQSVKKK